MRRPPHRRSGRLGARSTVRRRLRAGSVLALLLVAGVASAGAGVNVAGAETPAHEIARLRSRAAAVQAAIDHMNDQVEIVVEQFNANNEALRATLDRQRDTTRRLDAACRRLGALEGRMGDRMRAIYMGGPVTGLEQMLEVRSVADAVTVARYQESASDADVRTIAAVQRSRQELASIAATLDAQRQDQERLQTKLDSQRHDIEDKLARQRDYLARLGAGVKRAVADEQRRQQELQRRAIARQQAAEKAARDRRAALQARRDRAAREAAARSGHSGGHGSSSGGSGSASASGGSGSGGSGSAGSASSPRVPSSPAGTSAGRQAVAYARAQLGKPYVWSAEGPDGFDCSGLTMMAWHSAGVSIPRVSGAQYGIGRHVSRSALEPGDLVFFGNPIHHVGLYVGGGMMIEAPYTGQVVRYHTIDRSDYAGATRPTG